MESPLSWRLVALAEISGMTSEVLYKDPLPLSDVTVGQDGAMLCLRRQPRIVDVVYWDCIREGAPSSVWVSELRMEVLELFGASSSRAFLNTGRQLLEVVPGEIRLVYEAAKATITAPELAPDGMKLLWIEKRASRRKLVTQDTDAMSRRREWPFRDDVYNAVWLSEGEIVVETVRKVAGQEDSTAVWIAQADGSTRLLFETYRSVPYLSRNAINRRFGAASPGILASQEVRAHQSEGIRDSDRVSGAGAAAGVWIISLDASTVIADCVANLFPRTIPVMSGERVIFACQGATVQESRLIVAHRSGGVAASVPNVIRGFALPTDGSCIVFRELLDSGCELRRVSLFPLNHVLEESKLGKG